MIVVCKYSDIPHGKQSVAFWRKLHEFEHQRLFTTPGEPHAAFPVRVIVALTVLDAGTELGCFTDVALSVHPRLR
jgi:hypothetical protein